MRSQAPRRGAPPTRASRVPTNRPSERAAPGAHARRLSVSRPGGQRPRHLLRSVSALLGSDGVDVAVSAIDVMAAADRALHVGRLRFGNRSHDLESLLTVSTDVLVDWHSVLPLKARPRTARE